MCANTLSTHSHGITYSRCDQSISADVCLVVTAMKLAGSLWDEWGSAMDFQNHDDYQTLARAWCLCSCFVFPQEARYLFER